MKKFLKVLLRRLFRRSYHDIAAPLRTMAEDLRRLQEINTVDNDYDTGVIVRISNGIHARNAETRQAAATEEKIRSLLA
jgi:hypothetical protein